jgi:hypothetical protein
MFKRTAAGPHDGPSIPLRMEDTLADSPDGHQYQSDPGHAEVGGFTARTNPGRCTTMKRPSMIWRCAHDKAATE